MRSTNITLTLLHDLLDFERRVSTLAVIFLSWFEISANRIKHFIKRNDMFLSTAYKIIIMILYSNEKYT